jgi:hypothetical protein
MAQKEVSEAQQRMRNAMTVISSREQIRTVLVSLESRQIQAVIDECFQELARRKNKRLSQKAVSNPKR